MLSLFPTLFDYAIIAPLILRIGLALVLINHSFKELGQTEIKKKLIALINILSGLLLFLGFLTQLAAGIIALSLLLEKITGCITKKPVDNKNLRFIMFVVAISLLLLGPGIFSVDMPL